MKLVQLLVAAVILAGFYSGSLAWATSVEVDPETIEILLRPGDSSPNFLKYTNLTDSPLEVAAEVRDLTPVGEDADVTTTNDPALALTPFISLQSNKFTVPAKSSRSVEFVVTAPEGTKSGGRLGGIALTSPGQPELGSLIMLNISGYIYKSPTLASFKPEVTFTPGPASLTARVSNPNTNFLKVVGQIKLYDLLNREVAILDIPPHNLLPGVTRRINMTWDKTDLIGLYRAELSLFNDKTQDKMVSSTFVIGTAEPGVFVVTGLFVVMLGLMFRRKYQ